MLNRIVINPHSASDSATRLAAKIRELTGRQDSVLRLRHEGSRYRPRITDLFFNYGDSQIAPAFYGNATALNTPDFLAKASNKKEFFTFLEDREPELPLVDFCLSRVTAQRWLDAGEVVYARTKLQGHSGDGIVVCANGDQEDLGDVEFSRELVQAPLYTKGISGKRREYRIHVMKDVVVYSQLKRRKNDYRENPHYSNVVRNHHTGWIYSTQNIEIPEVVSDVARVAVKALGLDFGAVDVISQGNDAYVLEVNTAPGMSGTTLEVYATNLLRLVDGLDPQPLEVPEPQEEPVEEPAPRAEPIPEPAPVAEPVAAQPAPIPAQDVLVDGAIYQAVNGLYYKYSANLDRFVTFGVDMWIRPQDIQGVLTRVV